MTTAKDLKPGDSYLLPRQRKPRIVSKILDTTDGSHWHGGKVPDFVKDKILLILKGCSQVVLEPDQEVIILDYQGAT
jgi:hypothetical protein